MTKSQKESFNIYYKALVKFSGDIREAAIYADRKGCNPTCDDQDMWYEAINEYKANFGEIK